MAAGILPPGLPRCREPVTVYLQLINKREITTWELQPAVDLACSHLLGWWNSEPSDNYEIGIAVQSVRSIDLGLGRSASVARERRLAVEESISDNKRRVE
jgi:hypothetical protein